MKIKSYTDENINNLKNELQNKLEETNFDNNLIQNPNINYDLLSDSIIQSTCEIQ